MYQLSGQVRLIRCDEPLPVRRNRVDANYSILYEDGKPVQNNYVTFSVTCAVQPVSGKELATMPEGEQLSESYWLWCMRDAEYSLEAGDIVERMGDRYHVRAAENWGCYVRARAARIDTGPDTALDFEHHPGGGLPPVSGV